MASSQDAVPGPVLPVDAEALRKYTHEREGRDLRATCDLVPSWLLQFLPESLLFCCSLLRSLTGRVLQMSKFQMDNGVTLPATVGLKGTDLVLPLHRVVTFTGARFLRSVSLSTDINGESSSPEGLKFPEDELEIAKAVFSMMVDSPPDSVTVEQLRGVLRMCQICMADTLLGGFPAYLKGSVRSCASGAVRSLLSRV